MTSFILDMTAGLVGWIRKANRTQRIAVTFWAPTLCGQTRSPAFVGGVPGASMQIAPMIPAIVSGTVAMLRQDRSLKSFHRATTRIMIAEKAVPKI